MNRAPVRLVAILVALSLVTGCAARGDLRPGGIPVSVPEEHSRLMPQPVTRPYPDGQTVIKADGQFRGEDGLNIKEDSFVLLLLYPVDGQKASSKSIDFIRGEYMRQHQQESVLRVDDPFVVWVSF